MSTDYNLITTDGQKIQITTFGEENTNPKNCLIYVHGFKGFKDWGFVPYTAKYFASKNFYVVTFHEVVDSHNFSHNGIGENKTELTELEKFANNTISREISELNEVINATLNGFLGFSSIRKIGLIGHSRGGAVALIAASQRAEISAVATWSAISKFNRYTDRQKEQWKKNGYIEILNTRTNQLMRLNLSLLEDIEKNSNGLLNIQRAVENLNKPLLIAHGMQDLTVPIAEAEDLYNWSNKSLTEFFTLGATGHTFDIKHPFEGSNEKFEQLLNKTYNFFKHNLS
ncbi:alpha/beta hydrolase family protein [Melioribacteraceae bacterium 4301-Me]|uniref:alpha/beta hydrolase family protein n=1 Tax=Pyranulibacter aquaticus TaxID=3163344 RepID=UPI00359945BA